VLEEMHPFDVAIAEIASRQKGTITAQQLMGIGLSRSAIDHRVSTGRLHRVHRGVYLVGHPVPPPLACEQAALLACGGDSFLGYRTAGQLWDFLEYAGPVEVTVLGDRRVPGVNVHTTRRLERRDTTRRHGLPITTVARTIVDVAEQLGASDFERAVEDAFAQKRVTERQLRALVARTPGRKGAGIVRALLDYRGSDGFTRSRAEDLMRRLVKRARLPQPKANARVNGYEVDFFWPDHRVIVEVDSWAHHAGRLSFDRDRRKHADLEAAGYAVIPITWRQLTEEPEATAATIGAALALASRR
jgi:very-short-patch-repair endonuclease